MHNENQNQSPVIMGVPFTALNANQCLEYLLKNLNSTKQLFVATPNPEMLLAGRKNKYFKQVLNQTGLNIPDGIGIVFASKLTKKHLSERVTGTDLMLKICLTKDPQLKIFLLGANEMVNQKTAEVLKSKFDTNIVGNYSGDDKKENAAHICKLINTSGANILFVAFGAPKQEIWLAENLSQLPNIKIAMGVGGAFDFISESKIRAPKVMQKLGLEWLFRLIIEPKRIIRIFNATIKFPTLLLWDCLTKKLKITSYDPNVSS